MVSSHYKQFTLLLPLFLKQICAIHMCPEMKVRQASKHVARMCSQKRQDQISEKACS